MAVSRDGLFAGKTPVVTGQPTVDEFFSRILNKIRADDDTKRGNCLSCACETARVLAHPLGAVEIKVINDTNAKTHESSAISETKSEKSPPDKVKRIFEFSKEKSETAELLTFLDKEAKPGSVFITNTEDHVYILFKSYKDRLYLLDSDAHYYAQINEEKDFKAPLEIFWGFRDIPLSGLHHDYLLDNEGGEVKLKLLGLADPSWSKLLEPFEQPKSTLNMSAPKKCD